MFKDLARLIKALACDIRASLTKTEVFYLDDTPRVLGSKLRRF